jgi:hypothetical protein
MPNVNPPFRNLSLDTPEVIAVNEAVKRFGISASWKWIAKSSSDEFRRLRRLASGTPMRACYPRIDSVRLTIGNPSSL